MALAPGTRLGPYEILVLLGVGGMGEVYRARDASLKRDVAIKVLPPSYTSDSERLRRFQLEAQSAAALNHPNILSIFAVGEHEGSPYIVTELLQGETLREHLRNGPLRLREALDVGIGIARGLAAAHAAGIVHRDLKPENMFVAKDGHVKILDFGLAKLTQAQTIDAPTASVTPQTNAGQVMGTVGYMSPEQVRGQPADARSDIFALGAILYEMLTGKRAFSRPTSAETMSAILNEDLPADPQFSNNVPPALQRILRRCVEKNPEQRFQSALDAAFALDALSDSGTSTSAVATPTRSRRIWPWAVTALLLATSGVAWYFHRNSAMRAVANSPALEVHRLTESGHVFRAAASPDGRYVAYVNREHGQDELRLLQVATRRDVQILPGSPLRVQSLHFTPDGNFIYFLQELKHENPQALGVFRIATLGGPAAPIATDARMFGVTVSPDGKQIAYITQTATESLIVSVNPDGGNRRILATRPLLRGFWSVEWSPSPERLAASVAMEDYGLVLASVELPAGSIKEMSPGDYAAVGRPAWSPDGKTVFAPAVSNGGLYQIWAFDAHTRSSRPLTTSSTDYLQWSLSATSAGDLVANTITRDTTLSVADLTGKSHSIDSVRGEGFIGVTWVGDRIVTSNVREMIVHDADGRNPVTLRGYSNIYTQLTACGPARVAHTAHEVNRRIHIASTDINSGSEAAITSGPRDEEPVCTPDGSTLVFVRWADQGTRRELMRRTLSSGDETVLHELGRSGNLPAFPAVTPDGKNVLWLEVDGTDPYEWLRMMPIAGGDPVKIRLSALSEPGSNLFVKSYALAPDGRSILFLQHDRDGVGNIWSATLDGKPARKITDFRSDLVFAFDVSPDGRLVVVRGNRVSDVVLIKNAR